MNMMTTMEPPRAAPRARRSRRRKLAEKTALATAARFDRLGALFAAFDRDDMEAGVDLLISALDRLDGDTDLEPNGDELDGSMGEDDFHMQNDPLGYPGCPVSDPGGGDVNDERGDPSWIEWQTRGRHKVDAFGAEIVGRDQFGSVLHEDAEDDDPETGIDDDPRGCDPEEDLEHDGRDPDEHEPDEGYSLRKPHRDRIRRTRCRKVGTGPFAGEYRLIEPTGLQADAMRAFRR